MKTLHKVRFFDYSLVAGSVDDSVAAIAAAITTTSEPRWVACLNPHSHIVARKDAAFSRALQAADWLIPDGAGVVLASRFMGCPVRERITGSDVFYGVHDRLNREGRGRVFFLGSTEDILTDIRQRMAIDYPNLKVVGTFSPPYKPEFTSAELDEMIAAINAVRPDILWVGMTAPKQEKWIYQIRHRLQVKFIGAIGAVFDFYAGRVQRSHPLFQRLGLEWLPRLLQEPHRLWRRMLVSAPLFVVEVVWRKVRR